MKRYEKRTQSRIRLVKDGQESIPPGKVDDQLAKEIGFLNPELAWLQFNRRVLA